MGMLENFSLYATSPSKTLLDQPHDRTPLSKLSNGNPDFICHPKRSADNHRTATCDTSKLFRKYSAEIETLPDRDRNIKVIPILLTILGMVNLWNDVSNRLHQGLSSDAPEELPPASKTHDARAAVQVRQDTRHSNSACHTDDVWVLNRWVWCWRWEDGHLGAV